MNVKQLMSTNTVTIDEQASCREAIALMCRYRIRHLPVVDDQGRLAGIVTDRDVRHHLFRPDVFRSIGSVPVEQLLAATPVPDIMSTPVISVAPGATLDEAARRMREDRVGALPVVEDGRIVGIVTETDLLQRILGEDVAAPDVAAIVISCR
jgi:CBS domain-containing protein